VTVIVFLIERMRQPGNAVVIIVVVLRRLGNARRVAASLFSLRWLRGKGGIFVFVLNRWRLRQPDNIAIVLVILPGLRQPDGPVVGGLVAAFLRSRIARHELDLRRYRRRRRLETADKGGDLVILIRKLERIRFRLIFVWKLERVRIEQRKRRRVPVWVLRLGG